MKEVQKVTLDDTTTHMEYASGQRVSTMLQSPIEYDSNGPAGIFRSPYVFGAALLASLGGFSFGYGKVIVKPLQSVYLQYQTKALYRSSLSCLSFISLSLKLHPDMLDTASMLAS